MKPRTFGDELLPRVAPHFGRDIVHTEHRTVGRAHVAVDAEPPRGPLVLQAGVDLVQQFVHDRVRPRERRRGRLPRRLVSMHVSVVIAHPARWLPDAARRRSRRMEEFLGRPSVLVHGDGLFAA
ncbi:hypothetical protein HPB48_010556 [Haemaphysalis longicornis]|uniref:Uncharacterized protein n=1 Tax=Haemaphysalis longicornis TaxID=44386 RepID=A0A9J6H400_HAELO|nr:hypothetical protein HPB48_010556 [Haemaphysalis longicornis]